MTPELKHLIDTIKLRLKNEPSNYHLRIYINTFQDINDFYEKTPLAALYREIPDIPSGTDKNHYQFSINKVLKILNKNDLITEYDGFTRQVVVRLKTEKINKPTFATPNLVSYKQFQNVVKERNYFNNLYLKWKLIALIGAFVYNTILAIIFFS